MAAAPTTTAPTTTGDDELEPRVAREVAAALRRVRYGSITIVVHDGNVQSVDVTEKRRFSLK